MFRQSTATFFLWGNCLGAGQLRCSLMWVLSCALWLRDSNSVLDFTSHQCESLLHIFAVLCRCFQETYVKMFSKFLSFFEWDCTLIFKITLVTNQDTGNIVGCMLLNLTHPCLNSRKALSVSNIISHNDTMCTLVVARGNCLKTFLSCSIPYLKFYCFAININSTDFEIDTNSWHEVFSEDVILQKKFM